MRRDFKNELGIDFLKLYCIMVLCGHAKQTSFVCLAIVKEVYDGVE